MFRAVSTRIQALSAAVVLCAVQAGPSCDAGSILHRRTPKPAASVPQAGLIVMPQPAPTFVYSIPGVQFMVPPTQVPAAASDALQVGADSFGGDVALANEVSSLARDPQYLWLASRLGGEPARVMALKDHLRVALHREMRRQNGRVQAVNWPKFLENAAILFLKATYAFNAANPWEPALAIIQRLIGDILREEGLIAPTNNCPPPAPPAPSADPNPAPSPTTRARIIGTVELEILDPSPDLTPTPFPPPLPAPRPEAPQSLPEPLPQNDDAAPPPPPTP